MLTNSRDIKRRLETEGWVLMRQKGSHHQYKLRGQGPTLTLTHPKKDMPIGTVRDIYRGAGWAIA